MLYYYGGIGKSHLIPFDLLHMKYSLIASAFAIAFTMFAPVQALSIHWDETIGNTAGWSSSTSTNTDSGVIGGFDAGDSVILITDPEAQSDFDNGRFYDNKGLALTDRPGYLTYSFGSLGGFGGATLSLVFKDAVDEYTDLQKDSWNYPAPYIFLEGMLNGERMLLAYEVAAQPTTAGTDEFINVTLSLSAANFLVVDEFYHVLSNEPYTKFQTADRLTPVVTLGSALSDAEFESFLASCSSLSFRAYHSFGTGSAPILGLQADVAYTYIQSLDITVTQIPEPSVSCFGLLGIMGLAARRRRMQ